MHLTMSGFLIVSDTYVPGVQADIWLSHPVARRTAQNDRGILNYLGWIRLV